MCVCVPIIIICDGSELHQNVAAHHQNDWMNDLRQNDEQINKYTIFLCRCKNLINMYDMCHIGMVQCDDLYIYTYIHVIVFISSLPRTRTDGSFVGLSSTIRSLLNLLNFAICFALETAHSIREYWNFFFFATKFCFQRQNVRLFIQDLFPIFDHLASKSDGKSICSFFLVSPSTWYFNECCVCVCIAACNFSHCMYRRFYRD